LTFDALMAGTDEFDGDSASTSLNSARRENISRPLPAQPLFPKLSQSGRCKSVLMRTDEHQALFQKSLISREL
jgi:hypothetical protein